MTTMILITKVQSVPTRSPNPQGWWVQGIGPATYHESMKLIRNSRNLLVPPT
jgi:hypothetical protein